MTGHLQNTLGKTCHALHCGFLWKKHKKVSKGSAHWRLWHNVTRACQTRNGQIQGVWLPNCTHLAASYLFICFPDPQKEINNSELWKISTLTYIVWLSFLMAWQVNCRISLSRFSFAKSRPRAISRDKITPAKTRAVCRFGRDGRRHYSIICPAAAVDVCPKVLCWMTTRMIRLGVDNLAEISPVISSNYFQIANLVLTGKYS